LIFSKKKIENGFPRYTREDLPDHSLHRINTMASTGNPESENVEKVKDQEEAVLGLDDPGDVAGIETKDSEEPETKDSEEPETKDDDVVLKRLADAVGIKRLEEPLVLKTKTGESFEVTRRDALLSDLFKAVMEDDNATEIDVDLASDDLVRIVEYLKHHNGVTPEAPVKPKKGKLTEMKLWVKDEWDATYIDGVASESLRYLYDLARASNFVGVITLTKLCCLRISHVIRGIPVDLLAVALDPDQELPPLPPIVPKKNMAILTALGPW
jgi:hypothetical protein